MFQVFTTYCRTIKNRKTVCRGTLNIKKEPEAAMEGSGGGVDRRTMTTDDGGGSDASPLSNVVFIRR